MDQFKLVTWWQLGFLVAATLLLGGAFQGAKAGVLLSSRGEVEASTLYAGDNIKALVQAVENASLRGEFERPADAAGATGGKLPEVLFVSIQRQSPWLSAKYDAAAELVSIGAIRDGSDIQLLDETREVGTFVGKNAYGATAKVKDVQMDSWVLQTNLPVGCTVIESKPLRVPIASAKALIEGSRIVLVVRPLEDGLVVKPVLIAPTVQEPMRIRALVRTVRANVTDVMLIAGASSRHEILLHDRVLPGLGQPCALARVLP